MVSYNTKEEYAALQAQTRRTLVNLMMASCDRTIAAVTRPIPMRFGMRKLLAHFTDTQVAILFATGRFPPDLTLAAIESRQQMRQVEAAMDREVAKGKLAPPIPRDVTDIEDYAMGGTGHGEAAKEG